MSVKILEHRSAVRLLPPTPEEQREWENAQAARERGFIRKGMRDALPFILSMTVLGGLLGALLGG